MLPSYQIGFSIPLFTHNFLYRTDVNNYYDQASIYLAQGEYEEAKNAAEKGLVASRAAGDKMRIAYALRVSGEVAWLMEDLLSARLFAEASLALFQELGLTGLQHEVLNLMGNIASSLGDFRQARSYFYPILEANLKTETLDIWWVVEALTGVATILAREGKTAQAVELLDFVLHQPKAAHKQKVRAAKLMAELVPKMPSQSEAPARPLDVVISELLNE